MKFRSERELFGYLWNRIGRMRRPKTSTLFLAIAGEAESCLVKTDWDERLRNIQNIVSMIRWRMDRHWEQWHESELEKLAKKAKESDVNVE
jgi:hypothetical protein